jgi:CRP-like cAMP-binding protein
LPPEAMEDFRAIGQMRMCKPRQVLFGEGNPCEGLYLLCHGNVKLYHSDRFGREHILEIAGPGTVLGEFAANGDETMSASAEALTESQISFLPHDAIVTLVQKHSVTAVRLIEALSRELATARRKTRDLALKPAESRLAGLLLQLCKAEGSDAGQTVALPYSRRELAEMIGVSTETAIRLLSKMKKRGIIQMDRNGMRIAEVERLTRIAEHGEV